MAQSGITTLGSSNIGPVLSDWLDNQAGDSWLTLDNRLSVAIGATPAWAEGSPDLPVAFTLPALRRSTIPIDPSRGVQLQVLDTQQLLAPANYLELASVEIFGGTPLVPPPGGTTTRFVKRSLPYLLHSAGGAPSELLYPPETWLPAVTQVLLTGPAGAQLWVGNQQDVSNGMVAVNQLAYAPTDTAIMAATFTLMTGSTCGGQINQALLAGGVLVAALGDPITSPGGSGVNTILGQQLIFSPADQVGTTVTLPMFGCRVIDIRGGNFTPATDNYNVQVTAWLGVPPTS
jgi:hypothetical protein